MRVIRPAIVVVAIEYVPALLAQPRQLARAAAIAATVIRGARVCFAAT